MRNYFEGRKETEAAAAEMLKFFDMNFFSLAFEFDLIFIQDLVFVLYFVFSLWFSNVIISFEIYFILSFFPPPSFFSELI